MASVRKFRDNWIADYRDQWGKRHREKPAGFYENKSQQKRAAHALLKRRMDEVDQGSYSPETNKLTFAKLADKYLESKVNIRPSTRRSYECAISVYLKPYFGSWRVRQISAADVERYRTDLSNGLPAPIVDAFAHRIREARPALSQARARQKAKRRKVPSPRTINKSLTLLVMIFNYACRHRWIDFNPAEYVEKLKIRTEPEQSSVDTNILSPDEVKLLIGAARPAQRDKNGFLKANNYRLIIQVAVFTGMRSGELKALKWGDVDWASNQIHIRRSYKEGEFHAPKTKTSTRLIEIPKILAGDLQRWKLACPKGELDLIFPNLNGLPLSNANLLQRGFYPALRRAGLRKIRFHDLRHTFASLLIANGEDIVRVSRLLGHASPKITLDVYSHMLPNSYYGTANRLADLVMGDPVENTLSDCQASNESPSS